MAMTAGSPDDGAEQRSEESVNGVPPTGPRRRLLLSGLPIAVTLASRPALAQGGQCTASIVMSGNLSHTLPVGTNCGLTPLSWTKLAGTNQLWPRTGFYPSGSFTTACGGSPPFNSAWSCSGSLQSALGGGLTVQCRLQTGTVSLDCSQFGPHMAAALLNAACFAPTNYPLSTASVSQLVRQVWSSKPTSKAAAQSQLDSACGAVKGYNIND